MSASEEKGNPIMRAAEVCKLLKIGRNTLYQWCEQDLIPHTRVGRLIFFSRKVIDDLFENKMEGGKK